MVTILGYIIPAAGLIIVQLIISFKQEKVNFLRYDMMIQDLKKDISRLEQKQDKHNQLIERVTKLEMNEEAQWKWIDQLKPEKKEV